MTTDTLPFESIDYTAAETGALIRKALRTAFPGVKFSLRGSRGTGYGWFSCSWTDGPTDGQVRAVCDGFRSSYFDGMDDSTHVIPARMYAERDGVIREHRYTCHGVNTSRDYSEDAIAWATTYADAKGPDLTWRTLSAVDLTGVDWTTVPAADAPWTGSHVRSSYVIDDGHTYGYEPRHRAA